MAADESVAEWLRTVLDERHCMDCKVPAAEGDGTREFHGATLALPAGLVVCCEVDDALGLTETATGFLIDCRGRRNVQHPLIPLLRQSVYSRLAGYEDTNEAEHLTRDLAMRVVTSRQASEKPAASTNTLSQFGIEVLT
jgi:hypothetical protein